MVYPICLSIWKAEDASIRHGVAPRKKPRYVSVPGVSNETHLASYTSHPWTDARSPNTELLFLEGRLAGGKGQEGRDRNARGVKVVCCLFGVFAGPAGSS